MYFKQLLMLFILVVIIAVTLGRPHFDTDGDNDNLDIPLFSLREVMNLLGKRNAIH